MMIAATTLAATVVARALRERSHDVLAGASAAPAARARTGCRTTARPGSRRATRRVEPDREHHQRGSHRDQPADHERDRAADEALHDDLPGVRAHAGAGQPRGQQRHAERDRGAGPDSCDRSPCGPPRSSRRRVTPWNSEAATTSIAMLTRPAMRHRHADVEALEAQQRPRLGVVAGRRCGTASEPSGGRSRAASPSRPGCR